MSESDNEGNSKRKRWPGSKHLRNACRRIIEQGLAPKPFALAVATGATIGVLPTVWGTSVICLFLAWCLRLNHVVVQTANYLVYPLQIALFLPFSSCGKKLFPFWFSHTPAFSLNLLTSNWSQLDNAIIATQLSALLGWILTTPALSVALYLCTFKLCQYRNKHNLGAATH